MPRVDNSVKQPNNPFPGLRAYQESENFLFFGRQRQLDELLRKLRTNHFLTVLGNAGSGKSSLVRAGLIPKLRSGKFSGQGGENWRIAVCRPGTDPLGNLAAALAEHGVLLDGADMEPNYPGSVKNTLEQGGLGIVNVYDDANVGGDNLMIVVDQFEEIFPYCREGNKRKRRRRKEEVALYINLLLNASRQKKKPVYVVLTMRTSFVGDSTEFRGLPEAINDGQFLMPKMKSEDLKKAMLFPISSPRAKEYHQADTQLEDEVKQAIINDLDGAYDQLAVFQHLMARMWEKWEEEGDPNAPITMKHYNAVGRINGALDQHLEEVYSDIKQSNKGAEKALICQKMFRLMTEKGAEGLPTRRYATVKEMMAVADCGLSEVKFIVLAFSRPDRLFLSAPSEAELDENSTISIAHESVMQCWYRLGTSIEGEEYDSAWIDRESESADTYLRIVAAANLYYEGKGGLWRDPELAMGLNWKKQENPNAAWAKRYSPGFLETMAFLEDSEKENQKMLAASRFEQENRVKRSNMIGIAGLLVGILCILAMSGVVVMGRNAVVNANQARKSEQKAKRQTFLAELGRQEAARQQFQAGLSAELAKKEKDKAETATIASIFLSDVAESEAANARKAQIYAQDAAARADLAAQQAAIERDNAIASKEEADEARKAAEKAENDARRIRGLSLAQSVAVKSTELEDDLVQGLLAKEAHDLSQDNNGTPYDPFIYRGVYEAINKLQANRNNAGFNMLNQKPQGYDRIGAVRAIRPGADDQFIYTTGSDGFLLEWAMPVTYFTKADRKANPPEALKKPNGKVFRAMDISPDGKWLVRGGDQTEIEIFKTADKTATPITSKAHKGSRVWAIAFMPDSKGFISSGADRSIQYTTIEGKSSPVVSVLPSNMSKIISLAISSDGRYLAAVGSTSEVVIWNIITGDIAQTLGVGEDKVSGRVATAVAMGGKDDRFVAVGFADGIVRIWDLEDTDPTGPSGLKVPEKFSYHYSQITDIEFSKDGTRMIAGSMDKSATLWQIQDPKASGVNRYPYKNTTFAPIQLDDHKDWVMSVAFTNNGDKAITGANDGTIKYWETDMSFYAEEICAIVGKNLNDFNWRKYLGTDDPNGRELYINTAQGPNSRRTPISTCIDPATGIPYAILPE